jgi:hypothetical protein
LPYKRLKYQYPAFLAYAKWTTVIGFSLFFFGGRDFSYVGLYVLGGAVLFMGFIWFTVKEHEEVTEEFRRRKGGKD